MRIKEPKRLKTKREGTSDRHKDVRKSGVMKVYLAVLLLIIPTSAFSFGQPNKKSGLVTFKLIHKNQVLATIQVPAGYKEETKSYVEGVQTTLSYPDGSYIVLHVGGMIKLRLFTAPKHQVCESQSLTSRVIKSGRVQNAELFWREENSQGVWPPTNIGFTNVPKKRLKLFEKSLKSFARAK